MDCPCCGREGIEFDRVNRWSKSARAYVFAWTVYRCPWCAGESEEEGAPTEECACGHIFNDGDVDPQGYGCDL